MEFLAGAAIALIMRRIIQKVIGNFEALVLISNFEKEIGNEGRVITSSADMYFKCIYDMFFKSKNFRHLVV